MQAVRADHVAGTDRAGCSVAVGVRDGHSSVIGCDPGDLVGAVRIGAGFVQPVQQHRLGDVLRHHQGVGVGARQAVEGHGGQGAGTLAHGEPGYHDAAFVQILGHAKLVEHFQGPGVHHAGSRGVGPFGMPVK